MQCQATLLLGRLGRDESHVRPGNCLADRLGINGIILVPLHIRLHVGRRHQAHGVAKRLELARPMMRRGASLDTNQAGRQPLEECNHVAPLELPADDYIALRIDRMNLKDRLRDVETNCRDRLHNLAPPNRGGPNSTHIYGTRVPVEEPSTASFADGHITILGRRIIAAGLLLLPLPQACGFEIAARIRGPLCIAASTLTTSGRSLPSTKLQKSDKLGGMRMQQPAAPVLLATASAIAFIRLSRR
jgi:hypothetical protein